MKTSYPGLGRLVGVSAIVFALAIGSNVFAQTTVPEPAGWFAGDMHVHRSCGGQPVPISTITQAMDSRKLAVVSLLADMGNGEVQNPVTDLPAVNGQDHSSSLPDRIVHWDAEWHWDATYKQFPHQALGGHLVLLGLSSAEQLFREYTFPILDWAHQQGAIGGFAHLQYLDGGFPDVLNCCIPIEYPVEVALKAADFISEDVAGSDTAVEAYYRLLNCGFRPGFAGGSDYPCGAEIGDVLTYVKVANGLTYNKWISGIKNGQTVVSRNGHLEFLDLTVNGSAQPGDEISLGTAGGDVNVSVVWTAIQNFSGRIELVHNGQVVAVLTASATPSAPATLNATVNFSQSGWLAARRMSARGHELHTAAVFVNVNNTPVRASVADAEFYVAWMDELLARTSPGGVWNSFFPTNLAEAQSRYTAARNIYRQIALEAAANHPVTVTTESLPSGSSGNPYSATLTASGGIQPYVWSIAAGSLPAGLSLNASTGTISGTPGTTGSSNFTVRVTDSSVPVKTDTSSLTLIITSATGGISIWPASAVPTLVDGGADNPVELGVKFRSDVAGSITGIRFYKAATNTGTHVGSLWSTTGTLLASATFTSETSSGWQQVLFSSPVTISPNTVYIASYHCINGHYSANLDYFAATGADNAPLHALANGVSGGNGVYTYGPARSFPTQTWRTANYWVDLVFTPSAPPPPPTLVSIDVTPAGASLAVGATQAYTATGVYSDATTQNLTSQASWASSAPAVAAINATGIATATTPGTTSISATVSSISGSTTLTVQSATLAISSQSLPAGTVGASYSASPSATGGIAPYTWSLASGSLPPGLALNAGSGAIAGTPTDSGTFNFVLRVADSGTPAQQATRSFAITINAALVSISVTPSSTAISVGATAQFSATANYSDATTRNVTSEVTWASSASSIATVNSAGQATGVAPGTSTISATLGTINGSATLTVQTLPPTISTETLPNGTVNAAYSASLTVSGGVAPFSWSVSSGSLPAGLNINVATGAITGIPTTAGSFPFAVRVVDSSSPVQAATKALNLTVVAAASAITLWPDTAVPTVVDSGPDSPVELGVKFRSDVAGVVTGIRFYKSLANTGTHLGNLWTTNGTRLSTATFTNETASGWQQVSFANPVPIQANTIYVASYHVKSGHYSADRNYFKSSGVDSPPLHALVSSGGSPNGVFINSSVSAFPTKSRNQTNYWVDVVFTPGSPSPLSAIQVTPANSTLAAGATQQFAATGTYSDGQARDITTDAAWSSSNPSVATLHPSSGLATGVSAGTTTVTATFSGISGSTTLTIQPAALSIVTASLPDGTSGAAYSAALNASGGTAPYTWSIASGTLPAGLTLNAGTGAITGTPTTAGLSSFTARVTDSAVPAQTSTKALTIRIASALVSIAVAPINPMAVLGTTRQFTATGTYSDGSTPDITTQVAWTSTSPGVASITNTGLATALSVGSTTIRASLNAVSGTTSLTVQPTPLVLATQSLSSGTVGTAYLANLNATGGTSPYTWSIIGGALPPGLTLHPTQATISGTPSLAGTFSFTVAVRDSGSPAQEVSRVFTLVITGTATRVTIWPDTAVPNRIDGGPDSPVELGVKFRSDVAGAVTGIRFYKATTNSGSHVANLWSGTGQFLATANFTNETASGWQEVSFSTPVAISANTVYVASYHCNSGHYSSDTDYFASSGVDNPPLHALASGVSGPNGVYRYGSGSGFPTETWQAANYWVDVVFEPGATAPPDTTAPTVSNVRPADGATGVTPGSLITVTFDEPMDPASINAGTILLRDAANNLVTATVEYLQPSRTAVLTPTIVLTADAPYTGRVKAGSAGVADIAGNRLATDFVWTFHTANPDPYGSGPGGPILVITDPANPFTRYLAEILLAEGLNAFSLADLATVTAQSLTAYDVVVLGQTSLTVQQVTMLTDWVNAGGNLIAMRPDKKLAGLLGLVDSGTIISNAYLLVDNSTGPGVGIVGQTIQYHGTADRYTLNNASRVATLYTSAQTATSEPAITLRSVGANGGHAAAFTYDLARSVVLTRQGNPAWAGQERDGFPPLRPNDLFFGGASGDPQPDWVNLNKVAIPQADEQQRLLANMIILMNSARKPLPRFHYFPRGHAAVIVMTGDDHGNGGTAGRFDQYLDLSEPGASVSDWEAIRSTSYIYVTDELTNAEVASYNTAGFEISLHLNTGEANYTLESGDALLTDQLGDFQSTYPSLPPPTTGRVHAIAWSGFTTTAELSWKHGIRLDTTYYYWPASWIDDRPGFMTGSGIPMRFATALGNVINVYQAPTQMTDESGQRYPFTIDTLLDRALGPEGFHGAFVANMHTDVGTSFGSDEIILSAAERGVPVISAKQLLVWLDARNSSSFQSIKWSNPTLSFSIAADGNARGLLAAVPVPPGLTPNNLQFNGAALPFSLRLFKGVQYAVFNAATGTYSLTFLPNP